MPERTPRLSLSFILPQQAHKHVTVNESLKRLDALTQLTVVSRTMTTQPAIPAEGDCYILPAGRAGAAWSGMAVGAIAAFADGAWSEIAPGAGWRAYVLSESVLVAFAGGAWSPVGGGAESAARFGVNTTADATNRLAVKADVALFNHDDVTPGSGDHRLIVNKAAAARTGTVLFQTAASGRAEFGLAGDDDFRVKVSADGAVWRDAIVVNRTSGAVAFPNTTLAQANADWTASSGVAQILNKPTLAAVATSGSAADLAAGTLPAARLPAHTGDVVSTAGSAALAIAADAVTYAKMQNVSATNRFLGRITTGAGDPEELTGTQATTLLDAFTSSLKGLAPASGGGTANFLRADGTWAAPPGAAGGETNTASNVNAGGVGVFKQKTGVNLEFRGVAAGSSKITVTSDSANNEIDIDVAESALTLGNLGGSIDLSGAKASGVLAAARFPALTGDVTTPAGSLVATIAAGAVAYGKIQNGAGLSVVGRSANTAGANADIAGTDGQVLRVSGTTLGFGAVAAAGITDGAVTTAKLADASVTTAKLADGAVTTVKLTDANVTFAKIQNVTASRLLGRGSASGNGAPVELSAGSGLTISGTTLQAGTLAASTETSGTLTVASANTHIPLAGDITLPASVFAAGQMIALYAGASSRTITQGSGLTLRLGGTATTGNRTLAARGLAVVYFVSATEAVVQGGSAVS